jgi:hypothetical protein
MIRETMQAFSSQKEAKRFLADKIIAEAAFQGEPLSELEKRLLLFSVEEPETANGIPRERLENDDTEFEVRVSSLLKAAYKRDCDIPQERERYREAMQELKKGDHYIVVMADDALASGRLGIPELRTHRVRDLLIYVASALALIGALVAISMWRAGK